MLCILIVFLGVYAIHVHVCAFTQVVTYSVRMKAVSANGSRPPGKYGMLQWYLTKIDHCVLAAATT